MVKTIDEMKRVVCKMVQAMQNERIRKPVLIYRLQAPATIQQNDEQSDPFSEEFLQKPTKSQETGRPKFIKKRSQMKEGSKLSSCTVINKALENEMRGTPNFKDGRSKFFNKSLPFGFRSPTLKLETEPKPNKGIPPRLRKDYPHKQKSARSSIENIERKYSDRKESDFVVVHKPESNIEWSKYFDINNDNKLKAQKVFTNMIIHDIKNPALTIEQALENLEELIGIHDLSEEDDVGAIDIKRKSLLEQTKSLCAGLKDSMGFMKSERIESGE